MILLLSVIAVNPMTVFTVIEKGRVVDIDVQKGDGRLWKEKHISKKHIY